MTDSELNDRRLDDPTLDDSRLDDSSRSRQPELTYRAVAALDFADLGDRALFEALRLCGAHPSAELHVVTVAEDHGSSVRLPGPEPRQLPLAEAEEATRLRVQQLVNEYLNFGHGVYMARIAIYVALGSPAERIVSLATALDADVIVLGTHGRRGLSRMLLGSVAAEVMRRAPCGVFVIRPRDFIRGEKVPELSPPLAPGEHPLRPFLHSHQYHYVDRVSHFGDRIFPA